MQDLTGKQVKVLSSLLQGDSVEKAAAEAQVGASTIFRWLKGDAVFAAEYRDQRKAIMTQTAARLQQFSGTAAATLVNISEDESQPASSRVSASRCIIEMACKFVELEDLAARIEALEAAVLNKDTPNNEQYQAKN